MTQKQRLTGADGVRALACLWVMCHHAVLSLNLHAPAPVLVLREQGQLGVGVFFVLSGLLLSLPYWRARFDSRPAPDLGAYVHARMLRIVPAFAVCLTFLFAVGGVFDQLAWKRFAAGMLFAGPFHWSTFFPIDTNGALWTIGVEVWFYLLLPVWMAGLWRIGSPVGWAAYWVGSIVVLMAWQVWLTRFDAIGLEAAERSGRELLILGAEWWPTRNPAGLFAHFLFGVLAGAVIAGRHHFFRDANPPEARTGWNRWDVLALSTTMLIVVEVCADSCAWPDPVSRVVSRRNLFCMQLHWPCMPLLVSGLLVSLCFSNRVGHWFDNRFLSRTALLSYGLYLWHMPIQSLTLKMFPGLAMGTLPMLVFVALSTAAAYTAAAISLHAIERPCLKWGKSGLPFGTPRSARQSAVSAAESS
jgi:peptidoglycan/LPS O-acetylase OafA/YrhL